jgi:exo-beta-1,3-glucanase (GH17 family)
MSKTITSFLLATLVSCLIGCKPTPTPIPTPTPTLTPCCSTTLTPTNTPTPSATSTPPPTPTPTITLFDKFDLFPWVDYAPTNYDPAGTEPNVEQVKADLQLLRSAGFRGIVTYSATGVIANVPRIAREVGFEGVVMGIWIPGDPTETDTAIEALPFVDGYVVGNEGLSFDRYNYETLEGAVIDLQQRSGKPVTTTEIFNLYFKNENLLSLGDWIFPNAHPYWQGISDPVQALSWTQNTFNALSEKAGSTPLILKEVGLPTSGAPRLGEYQQAEYYARLRESTVKFVYFEAFDQSWKTEGEVGTHWGLFYSDRTPKVVSEYILRGYPPFYVYADANASYNHFVPEGFMGCWQGIKVDQNDTTNPYSGTGSMKISYTPCAPGWAGIYWWDPPGGDWCDKQGGFDLTGWTKLTFWAKGSKGEETVEFKVGGLKNANEDSCDSISLAATTYPILLTTEWTQYTIPLYGQSLDQIAGGFVWVTDSTEPITIYLDEIKFEWSER